MPRRRQGTFHTIIVGAGIAGIACAQRLQQQGKNFLVITENIGGRIQTSADGTINYGAYFVTKNYHHILPFVEKKQRLKLFQLEFHDQHSHAYTLFKIIKRYPRESLRLLWYLKKFNLHYEKFKKQCEYHSQKTVIESDAFINNLYQQTASHFIAELGITNLAKFILNEGVYLCTFLPPQKLSAFDYLRLCLGLIVPIYEFSFNMPLAITPFSHRTMIDRVTQLKSAETHYIIHTLRGYSFKAKHVVIATPPTVTKQLLKLPKIKQSSSAYLFHIQGELRKRWKRGQFELFNAHAKTIFIRKQSNGTYLFYSKVIHPKLSDYFIKPLILDTKSWPQAFSIIGKTLLESSYRRNLFLIGDNNIIGLEDTYITGIYAANQIMRAEN